MMSEYDFMKELKYLTSPEAYGLNYRERYLQLADAARGAINRIEELVTERESARNDALEEAAKWHEQEIVRLNDQIEDNNAYMKRSGSHDNGANDSCRSTIHNHQWAAAAIRTLKTDPAPGDE